MGLITVLTISSKYVSIIVVPTENRQIIGTKIQQNVESDVEYSKNFYCKFNKAIKL